MHNVLLSGSFYGRQKQQSRDSPFSRSTSPVRRSAPPLKRFGKQHDPTPAINGPKEASNMGRQKAGGRIAEVVTDHGIALVRDGNN